ncbi:MAG: diphthine--ammonia ligase [Candidatus Abyssubacteria bacterium]
MALHELRKNDGCDVVALLTTVTEDYGRVSMHGIRESLLDRQAECLGLPLEKVYVKKDSSNEEYEARMGETLARLRGQGILSVAFGDIFLEDVRRHREEKLAGAGMKAIFPRWKRQTDTSAREFIRLGFKAIITCVDTDALDTRFVGRDFDEAFLSDLPANVDPCGENGEFHSFVYDGPIFKEPIRFTKGEIVLREKRFCYCDLLPW